MTNFQQIIDLLAQATEDLRNGKIKPEIAKQMAINTQVLINAAKLQFEVSKYSKQNSEFFSNNLIESAVDVEKEPRVRPKESVLVSRIQELSTENKKLVAEKEDLVKSIPPPKIFAPTVVAEQTEPEPKETDLNAPTLCNKCAHYTKCLVEPKCQTNRNEKFKHR